MDMLPAHELQRINETLYGRHFIDQYILQEIAEHPESEAKVHQGVGLIEAWLAKPHYESKERRKAQLKPLNLEHLVRQIFLGVAYCQTPELFTSVSAQLAGRLHFSDRVEAIQTVAELLAVLCQTDAFDITKPARSASLMIQSRLPLSDKLLRYIHQSEVLPPMVCEPRELKHNFQSAYLTVKGDSLILGRGNAHEGNICLDVLNTQNRVCLKLDRQLLSSVEEKPTFTLDDPEQMRQWQLFKTQSYDFYRLLISQGNRCWLTHKVDKRGRIYAQGYHVSTQGTAFKKASLELAQEEIVNGCPVDS